MNNRTTVNGTLILVLGIVGLVFSFVVGLVGLICGLVAWSMGDTAVKTLNAANIYDSPERTNANIGRICGIVAALLYLARLLLILMLRR